MRNWPRLSGAVGWMAALALAGVACSSGPDVCKLGKPCSSESSVDVYAALQLKGQADQFTRLQAIAARPYLRSADQVVLVVKTLEAPLSPAQKADILVTLAQNPSMSTAAKCCLLERLKEGALPINEEQAVLRAMVDSPASRWYMEEDAPSGVVEAVRSSVAVTTGPPVAEPTATVTPSPTRAVEAPPPPSPAPAPTVKPPAEPEPIIITPLPVK